MRWINNEYRDRVTKALGYMNSGNSEAFVQLLIELDGKDALHYAGVTLNVALGDRRPSSKQGAETITDEVCAYFTEMGVPLTTVGLLPPLLNTWKIGELDRSISPIEMVAAILTVLAFLDFQDHKKVQYVMDEIDRAVLLEGGLEHTE